MRKEATAMLQDYQLSAQNFSTFKIDFLKCGPPVCKVKKSDIDIFRKQRELTV